jgi:hypothetical protein
MKDEEVVEMVSLVEINDVYKRKINNVDDADRLKNSDNSFLTSVIHGMEEKLEEVS